MKRFTFALAVCMIGVLSGTTHAQDRENLLQNFNNGHWLVGANTGFEFSSQSGDLYTLGDKSVTTLDLSGSAGVFATRGLAIGALLSYASRSVDGSTSSNAGIGPFVQYFLLSNSAWVPSLAGGFLYQSHSGGGDFTVTTVLFRGAVSYVVSPNVLIGGGLQYQMDSYKRSGIDSINGNILMFAVSFGLLF